LAGAAPNFFRLLRDVDMAGCDYVALADQDDLWHPDKLARACQQLQLTGAAGYSGNVTAFWPGGQERLIDKAQPQQPWDFLFEGPGPGCTFVLAQPLALALQAWVRQQAQALQPVDFHDWLIYAWARAQGYRWLIDTQPCTCAIANMPTTSWAPTLGCGPCYSVRGALAAAGGWARPA
jgi:rhamnosyltransferase